MINWHLVVINPSQISTHSRTTDLKNVEAFSTVSSHTEEMHPVSKSDASGRARNALRVSLKSSLQRSESSPDLQARRSEANAKLIAMVHPTRARVARGFSSETLLEKQIDRFLESLFIVYSCFYM